MVVRQYGVEREEFSLVLDIQILGLLRENSRPLCPYKCSPVVVDNQGTDTLVVGEIL